MVRAILTDIEGTTSSISFVKDVLFPYARARLPAFIDAHGSEPAVRRQLDATADAAGLARTDTAGIVAVLRQWIDEDRKATPLKALQGMVWKDGYESGAFRAHFYPDVAPGLRGWKARGLALYVYSSGSVAAQKLFFTHGEAGNLSPLVDGWYDTETGGKRDPESYRRIARSIGVPAADVLFLSDIAEELDAARAAGMRTTRLCRAPETCPPDSEHACVGDFDGVVVD